MKQEQTGTYCELCLKNVAQVEAYCGIFICQNCVGRSMHNKMNIQKNNMPDLPRHSIESEKRLLGAIIIDPDILKNEYMKNITADCFFKMAYGFLFKEIQQLYAETSTVDLVLLEKQLDRAGLLEAVGGVNELNRCAASTPSSAPFKTFIQDIIESHTARQLVKMADEIRGRSYEDEIDIFLTLRDTSQMVKQLIDRLAICREKTKENNNE
tara:strand:+ start:725 stop:1357 length:633 start_codon:yes stop_codon:yes gene_type:complete